MTALQTPAVDVTADLAVVRRAERADLAALRVIADADPFGNVALAAHLESGRTADLFAVGAAGQIRGACYSGGTLRPFGGDPATWTALGEFVGQRPRTCSSVVASAAAMAVLRPVLWARWGPARRVCGRQPLLVVDRPAPVMPDPLVRVARIGEFDRYLPAAAAMFDEELGISPLAGADGDRIRAQLARLVRAGRVLVRTDTAGAVVFKAELAVVSRHTCQVQGVWVRPDLRARGIGTAAMAAVLAQALRLAPSVSLYVNDFNVPARRLYARLGMRQVGVLSTLLF